MLQQSYKEFVKTNHDKLKSDSEAAYRDSGYSVLFGVEAGSTHHEICFARLVLQLEEKKHSAYYILRLPYSEDDTINNMTAKWIDYPALLKDIQNIVKGVYDMGIYRSGYKNIKIITFENKFPLDKAIDYALILIFFCILRGMDSEYKHDWKQYESKCKYKPATTLFEYMYDYCIVTGSSTGHDINDDLATNFKKSSKLSEMYINNFVNILRVTCSDDKLLKDKRYVEYFKGIGGKLFYGHSMQTDSFDRISETTRRIILEDRK